METKLTLRLDNSVIKRAKRYAKKRKTSLSEMIENYLDIITSTDKRNIKISPLIKSLSRKIEFPPDFDYKKEYTKHLEEKYGKV